MMNEVQKLKRKNQGTGCLEPQMAKKKMIGYDQHEEVKEVSRNLSGN